MAESGMDTVQHSSMYMLQLRTGLNDDIMHCFSLMLAKRDAVLCSTTNTDANNTTKELQSHFAVLCSTTNTDANNTTKKLRSHFSNHFLLLKLLNEGCATNNGRTNTRASDVGRKIFPAKTSLLWIESSSQSIEGVCIGCVP